MSEGTDKQRGGRGERGGGGGGRIPGKNGETQVIIQPLHYNTHFIHPVVEETVTSYTPPHSLALLLCKTVEEEQYRIQPH